MTETLVPPPTCPDYFVPAGPVKLTFYPAEGGPSATVEVQPTGSVAALDFVADVVAACWAAGDEPLRATMGGVIGWPRSSSRT
jgi:hypothetical protein